MAEYVGERSTRRQTTLTINIAVSVFQDKLHEVPSKERRLWKNEANSDLTKISTKSLSCGFSIFRHQKSNGSYYPNNYCSPYFEPEVPKTLSTLICASFFLKNCLFLHEIFMFDE